MTKRVLVTGGAGFISSMFVRHLLEATPYEVVSLDALTYAGNLENLADVMAHERLSFVHGDIRDQELVRQLVSEVDVIVNAAAESHVEKSIEEGASEFVTTNVPQILDAPRGGNGNARVGQLAHDAVVQGERACRIEQAIFTGPARRGPPPIRELLAPAWDGRGVLPTKARWPEGCQAR